MQFIDGPSLQQAAKQLSMPDKAQVIRDAALALHAAHELGVIHRDIKPANIMLEKVSSADAATYRPVVMDFGLARESGEGKGLTASGTMMGTAESFTTVRMKAHTAHDRVVKVAVGYVRVSPLE